MDFELRLLRHALALAEHRNFARAAKAVHVSQPTLSRSIQELEQRTGTRLFDRLGAAGVGATAVGAVFLEHAREVISRASDFEREMDMLKGLEKGELRIGVGTYPSNMYVDRAMGRLLRAHPSVRIRVSNDNWAYLLPLLRKRDLDMAVIDITTAEADPEMQVIKLEQHQGYFAMRAGHPLLELKGPQQLAETWNYPFVATSRFPTALFKELAGTVLDSKRDTKPSGKTLLSAACESLHMMKTIAMESDAVALLPLNVVIDDVERGKMVVIPAPSWIRATFGVVHLAHRSLSPLGVTFVRLVQQADAELLEWEEKTAKKLFGQKRRPKADSARFSVSAPKAAGPR